jgi:hypothetical protein
MSETPQNGKPDQKGRDVSVPEPRAHLSEPRASDHDASIEGVLRDAGVRPVPDEVMTARVSAAVYREYLATLNKRRRKSWLFAAAAGFLVLLVSALYFRQSSVQPVTVARVSRIIGQPSTVEPVGLHERSVMPDDIVQVGDTFSVPRNSRLLLALRSGIGLRVNEATALSFEAMDRLRVDRGTVYIETPRGNPEAAYFAVVTAHGSVRHVGTRFEVAVNDTSMRIRVRDGAAVFRSTTGASATVSAGEQLDYRSGTASITQGPAPASTAWSWAESAAPEFRVDGRTLLEAIDWFAHEAGLKLAFKDAAAREQASAVILHGTVTGLAPRDAIAAIMAGTNLRYAIDDGNLLLGQR